MRSKITFFIGIVIVTACWATTASVANANEPVLSADATFVIAKKDYQPLVEKQKQDSTKYAFPVSDQTFRKPYKTTLSGIDIEIEYSFKITGKSAEAAVYDFSAMIKNPTISVERIKTKDKIYEQYGAIQVEAIVNASCRNVSATSANSEAQIEGQIQLTSFEGRLQFKVVDLKVQQSSTNWTIATGSCTGIKGYGSVIEQYMRDYLATNQSLESVVQDAIDEELTKLAQELNQSLMQSSQMDMGNGHKIELQPNDLILEENENILVLLSADLYIPKSQQNGTIHQHLNVSENFLQTRQESQLILPDSFLQRAVDTTYTHGLWNLRQESNKDPNIQELFSNRFGLFFIWPDLLNFDRKANFIFDIFPKKGGPTLSKLKQSGKGLSVNAVADIQVNMYAPVRGGHLPYVSFTATKANVPAQVDITKKGMEIHFNKSQVPLKAKWDDKYLSQYKPSTHISTGSISGYVEDWINDQRLTFPISPIQLDAENQLKAERLQMGTDSVSLIFSTRGASTPNRPRPSSPVVEEEPWNPFDFN